MKSIALIAIAVATLVLGSLSSAQAGDYRYSSSRSYGGGYGHSETPRYQPRYQQTYCKPYKVSTCEIYRNRECRTAYDRCGHPYTYHVTIVTYRDTYSDGSSRTYTSTFS